MYLLLPFYLFDSLLGHRFSRGWRAAIILLTTLFLAASFFRLMSWPGTNVLLVVSMSALAITYVLASFQIKGASVHYYGQNIFTATASIGIMFRVMQWPGANILFGSSVIIGLAALLFYARDVYQGKAK